MMASCNKKTLQNNFHTFYVYLCSKSNIAPLSGIKYHADKKCLDFYADKIQFDHWGPILHALSSDRTLHFIAIRSKHPSKDVLENIDSELKARAVMRRPVIYTKFMMDLMTNALVNCISASPCLTSVELEGLPLNLNYISLISNAFKKCPSVQNISFHGSCIGDDGCREVCQSIKDLLNIITLDFTNCGITEEGACHIAELIEYQRVQRLSESWKYSLRQQQPNMDGMSGLRRITLNRNVKIGRNGIICIVEVLMDDFWVKAIDFQDCGADEEVASYVLKLLDMNKVLSVIDLRGNKHISDKSLTYVMEKLNYNNKGVKFNWISLSEPSPTKKAHAQMAREICISESSPKVSAYKMRPKSATVRSARNISDMLGQRKSVTDVNKSPQQKSFNLSSPRSVSDTRLGELLKPIGKLCIRREDITPGMPRSLQQQEKRHCVWRSQSPPTVAPPPPTPELSSLHNTSSDIEEQILQMSKEQVVCIVREMAKERQASFQEIARLTAENRKLQAHLDKYHREMEKITLNTSGKVLVDETVMVNLQNIVEKVFETRNSERFFEQKETHLHGREFSNLITLPNNGFKLPDRSLKYNCDFSNTYPTCDESKDTTEYVTVSCNEECYERNLGVTDAEVVKYSMLLRCLTKEVTQMKVGDILENINCDITEGRDCQQLFELETNNYKSKQSELIYCAESCTSSLSGSPSGCDNTNSRYTPSSVSESVSSLGSSFLTC